MKKILFGLLAVAALGACKKDKDEPSCPKTIEGIANTYKLTSYKISLLGQDQESINNLDECTRTATYQLKTDKTIVITESGANGCTDSYTGSWDVVDNKITINAGIASASGYNIDTWNCTLLVYSFSQSTGAGTAKTIYTMTKQ